VREGGAGVFSGLGVRDVELVLAVSAQAGLLAYMREPRWKAAVFSLPIPFTMAALSLGHPVGASNVLALLVLFFYVQAVRVLHQKWHVPIVLAIALSAGGYILAGSAAAAVVPDTEVTFWFSCLVTLSTGIALLRLLPSRREPAYRSPLPVWLKLPIIAAVVGLLVTLKQVLLGFMTLFPMMGTVGAYEARHSLWTIGRQMPVVMITLTPMMAVCRLTQTGLGLGAALGLGWIAFALVFAPLTWWEWRTADRPVTG
jgi:hypothetical protein